MSEFWRVHNTKIRGTVKKDVTAYGNKYWIQIEDSEVDDNSKFEPFVDKELNIDLCLAERSDEFAYENRNRLHDGDPDADETR